MSIKKCFDYATLSPSVLATSMTGSLSLKLMACRLIGYPTSSQKMNEKYDFKNKNVRIYY